MNVFVRIWGKDIDGFQLSSFPYPPQGQGTIKENLYQILGIISIWMPGFFIGEGKSYQLKSFHSESFCLFSIVSFPKWFSDDHIEILLEVEIKILDTEMMIITSSLFSTSSHNFSSINVTHLFQIELINPFIIKNTMLEIEMKQILGMAEKKLS